MKVTLTIDEHGVTLLNKVLPSKDKVGEPRRGLALDAGIDFTAQELQAAEDIKRQIVTNT